MPNLDEPKVGIFIASTATIIIGVITAITHAIGQPNGPSFENPALIIMSLAAVAWAVAYLEEKYK